MFRKLLSIGGGGSWAQTPKERYERLVQIERQFRDQGARLFDPNWKFDKEKEGQDFQKWLGEESQEVEALETAAKAGDAEAAYYIGTWRFHQGQVDEAVNERSGGSHPELAAREYQQAIAWWKPWAERGHPAAQWAYGTAFAEARGVNRSPSNAIEWWYKAAIAYHRAGDREDALTLYDAMRKLDSSNPLVSKLSRTLFHEPK